MYEIIDEEVKEDEKKPEIEETITFEKYTEMEDEKVAQEQ